MPLIETLPVGADCAQWNVWGTVARVVATDPWAVDAARAVVEAELAAVDEACSRFRADSELHRVARAAGRPVRVSARLAALVGAGIDAARATDGDVDPTIGSALCALGYDHDFAVIATETGTSESHRSRDVIVRPDANWRDVRLDGDRLIVPHGVRLDLGATAKAWAADRGAALACAACGAGVLVALGGDIATAGPAPEGGWRILVQDGPSEPACTITLPAGAALATSSTISRSWRDGARTLHHILDPRTGRPASRTWRTVSVAAFMCVRANTLTTAAVVRGLAAPGWLRSLGVPARLVAADRGVHTLGGWPRAATS